MTLLGSSAAGRARRPSGARVAHVEPDSPAARAGILRDDVIVAVNRNPIADFLDFYVAAFERMENITVERNGSIHTLELEHEEGGQTGLVLETGQPRRCNNKCIFCFVDQLPPGLRDELYIKDEDYRLSFLHGNYVTLSNLEAEDEKRITELHLSPLYVSVHATDPGVRDTLLGRHQSEPILAILDRLAEAGIRFHCQIVVVPGYNDGSVLEQSLEDLVSRRHVLSVSLVPVGLTAHRKTLTRLEPVGRGLARTIIHLADTIQGEVRPSTGRGIVYASDEMFEIAGVGIPEADYYDDYPQLENGVGLVRLWLDSSRNLKMQPMLRDKRLLLVTGRLAHPYIEDFSARLGSLGIHSDIAVVTNHLLGENVTVSGLLSGRDIGRAIEVSRRYDAIVLPPNVVNHANRFIDDLTPEDLERNLGIPVVVGDYDSTVTLERVDARLKEQRRRDE